MTLSKKPEPLNSAKAVKQLPRVLHVLEATLGGTLRYLNNVIDALEPASFDLALAYSTGRADPDLAATLERARAVGWKTYPLEMTRQVSPASDMGAVFELRKIIRGYDPHVLHCHSSKAGAIGRIARFGRASRTKILYSPHAIAANLGRQYLYAEKALRAMTDRFAAVSEGEREELVRLRIAPLDKVDVVYPLIDTSIYEPQQRSGARALLGVPEHADLIIGIGRLTDQKDPLFFCKVVHHLVRQNRSVRAIWLGDGLLRSSVSEFIRTLGLESVVTMAGWQPDVRPYLAAANVLLSTSQYESFGYMVAEAMAMERPVVATAISGTKDIMSEVMTELLYPVGSVEAAASRVAALLNDPIDAQERGQLGRAFVSKRFSRLQMNHSLTACYANLLSRFPAPLRG